MAEQLSKEYITEHFKWSDMTQSNQAARRGVANPLPTHDPRLMANIHKMVKVMESVRSLCGNRPIYVSSLYRCPAVNRLVGGSRTSAHMQGLACDFVVMGRTLDQVVSAIVHSKAIRYDQVIREFGAWIHLGLRADDNDCRYECVSAEKVNGKTTYRPLEPAKL